MTRTVLSVGVFYKCPEGHKAKIMWISEDKKLIAVQCPRRHFSKVVKVADLSHFFASISFRFFGLNVLYPPRFFSNLFNTFRIFNNQKRAKDHD